MEMTLSRSTSGAFHMKVGIVQKRPVPALRPDAVNFFLLFVGGMGGGGGGVGRNLGY